MLNLWTNLPQLFVDFAENRMVACQTTAEKRALKYGSFSFSAKFAFSQEQFWDKVMIFFLHSSRNYSDF